MLRLFSLLGALVLLLLASPARAAGAEHPTNLSGTPRMGEAGQKPYLVIEPAQWTAAPERSAQAAAGSAPDPDVKELIANGRVTARDVTWRHGTLRPANHFQDSITVFLQGGRMRIVKPDGSFSIVTRKTGDVIAERIGPADNRDAVDAPVRGIVIDLHDNMVPGITNTSGYPDAFPRQGSKKVLETARVIVWDYTFAAGQPSPMHFHSRDVVTIYTEDGAVTSTNPAGVQTVNNHHPGQVVFNLRNRTHTEQLTRGKVHVIAVELK
jgi:quercetin dioxygenase-like cupin family protein